MGSAMFLLFLNKLSFQTMSPRFEKNLFLTCLVLLFVVQGLAYAFAADGDAENASESSVEDYACLTAFVEQASPFLEEYEQFLDEYFQIDTPTSGQVEDAMDFYRYVEDQLETIYEENVNFEGRKSLEDTNVELLYCSQIRDQYIRFAQVLLQEHASGSSASKRSFEVVDGLKILNEDLEEFSETFFGTFPGAFNQMNNALPCYARQCITK